MGMQKSVWLEDDKIILRQSWLGSLAMCPERARQEEGFLLCIKVVD